MGTSFSGGHVLALAADDQQIAAVISQVPLIDCKYRSSDTKENHSWEKQSLSLGAVIIGIIVSWFVKPTYFVPVIAGPAELAAFIDIEVESERKQKNLNLIKQFESNVA